MGNQLIRDQNKRIIIRLLGIILPPLIGERVSRIEGIVLKRQLNFSWIRKAVKWYLKRDWPSKR